MGSTTGISWADRTKSAWHGCAHATLEDGTAHPGCLNCYAELGASRNPGTLGIWGTEGTRVQSKSFRKECEAWQKEAEQQKTIFSVFPSIHDPFEDRPDLIPWRKEMFEVIDQCPNLFFLLLTKRPGNIVRMTPLSDQVWEPTAERRSNMYRHNVALGCSISDQRTAEELVMKLIKASFVVPLTFVSAGPLLDLIDLTRLPNSEVFAHHHETFNALTGEVTIFRDGEEPNTFKASDVRPIGWVIGEGESTAKARPCPPDAPRFLRDQCAEAGVPFHWKQWGEWLPYEQIAAPMWESQRGDVVDGHSFPEHLIEGEQVGEWLAPDLLDPVIYRRVGKVAAGNFLDGRQHLEFPQVITERK